MENELRSIQLFDIFWAEAALDSLALAFKTHAPSFSYCDEHLVRVSEEAAATQAEERKIAAFLQSHYPGSALEKLQAPGEHTLSTAIEPVSLSESPADAESEALDQSTSVTPSTMSSSNDAIALVLSDILNRSKADIEGDARKYAALYWADEYSDCLGEDFEWGQSLPSMGGFLNFESEHSFYQDEPLFVQNIQNPSFAAFMEGRDGALPLPLANALLNAGLIEPQCPSVIGQVARGTLLDVATAVFTESNDLEFDGSYHTVDAPWKETIDAIADEELRRQVGCFFQNAQTARSYGAFFSGDGGSA